MQPNQQPTQPTPAQSVPAPTPAAPVAQTPEQQPAPAGTPVQAINPVQPLPTQATAPSVTDAPNQISVEQTQELPTSAAPVVQTPTPSSVPNDVPQQPVSRTKPTPDNKRPVAVARGKDDKTKNSAQNSLLIGEIRDNLVIMSDGTFRAVIVCKSINYDLMSEEERAGIEYSFQGFLNSLYFPIQISISSRRIDLSPYIEKLEGIRREQENMLLGRLTDDYLDFVFDISQRANIMSKSFFIVIPFTITGENDSAANSLNSIKANLFEDQKQSRIKITASDYAKAKEELGNRINVVLGGLTSIGIQAGQLPTKALAELYYNFYNPDTAINEPLGDYENFVGHLYTKKATAPVENNQAGGIL